MKLSIKSRISLWYMAVLIVVTVICIVIMQLTSDQFKLFIIKGNLENKAALAVYELKEHYTKPLSVGMEFSDHPMESVLVYDAEGHQLYGSAPGVIEKTDLTDGKFQQRIYDDHKIFLFDTLQYMSEQEPVWIRSYVILDSIFLLDKSIYTAGLVVTPIIILGAIMGGFFITRKIFNPINVIYGTVREISESGEMTKRIEVDPRQTDELTMLANMFNSMFDKLSASFESEKQFTMDASHELRTPLAVIMSQAEFLSRQLDGRAEEELTPEKKAVLSILNQAYYMNRLINSLLFIARMENNEQVLQREPIDLSELAEVVIEEMTEAAAVKEISLLSNIEEGVWIDADQGMVFRVFINLLSNSIEYSNAGGTVEITVARSEKGAEKGAVCCIADNGIGMAEDELPKIWQRFYQVDPARRRTGNHMGLGLFMVKKIIDLHGGTITVSSQPGAGTRFTFTL